MANLNQVTLVGNLGKDPEVKFISEYRDRVNFSLATKSSYKNKDEEWIEDTQWHQITYWKKMSDYLEKNLVKGALVLIEGTIKYTKHEEKWYTNIIASRVQVLNPKSNSNRNGDPAHAEPIPHPEIEDDLPF